MDRKEARVARQRKTAEGTILQQRSNAMKRISFRRLFWEIICLRFFAI